MPAPLVSYYGWLYVYICILRTQLKQLRQKSLSKVPGIKDVIITYFSIARTSPVYSPIGYPLAGYAERPIYGE